MTEQEFAQRLKQYRKAKGLTQQELADLLGVSNKSVSRWESGSYPDVATLGPLARALRASQAVSYGTSPRDTLTFSSLEGDRLCLAVQRELVTLEGAVVEQQELVLPFPTGASPLPALAAAGVLLLAGVPPEELPARLGGGAPGEG